MPTAQINARLSASLKQEGDRTLSRFGASATEAVRALWTYLGTERKLPDFMARTTEESASEVADISQAVQGAGLAVRLAQQNGLSVDGIQQTSYEDLRTLAFEELVEEGRIHV